MTFKVAVTRRPRLQLDVLRKPTLMAKTIPTTPRLNLDVLRKPTLKAKIIPTIAAEAVARNFLKITKANGRYTFDVDYSLLQQEAIVDAALATLAIRDRSVGYYKEVSVSSLLVSSLDADLQAIAALSGTGLARRTGANAWSLGAAVTNVELAQMPAWTFKANATAGSAAPTDIAIGGLANKPAPTTADLVLIQDQAAGGEWKQTTLGQLTSGVISGVASIGAQTGALTLNGGNLASTLLPVVRYDVAQTLTAGEKTQAQSNIGAQPAGNYQAALGYTPVNKAGDTVTGSLTISSGHLSATNGVVHAGPIVSGTPGDLSSVRVSAPTTGVIFLGNTGSRYLYWDGSNYNLPGGPLIANGYYQAVAVRLAYAADYTHARNAGLAEPYGGCVHTGASGPDFSGNIVFRYRYLQYQLNNGGWYTASYV
ncbi:MULTISPECIES: hypothetical protein [unclassified Bradyrhizobium]|uniref:hypothetical protein n=1 Tax=unclassified Bradyrhizobium TaxID=2631580 RepID=UPI002FF25BDB